MILVDIFVPSIDKTYDIQLNEGVAIDALIDEISEMIGQKEHSVIKGDVSNLQLCDWEGRRVLPKNMSLSECHIVTGKKLV